MPKKPPQGALALTDAEFHRIARALADPRRFDILRQIAAAPTVECSDLEQQKVISPATISHHLHELADAGLITTERNGRTATLALRRPVLDAYLARLASL